MPPTLSAAEVSRIAVLAKVHIEPADIDRTRADLAAVLGYMEILRTLPPSPPEGTAGATGPETPTRHRLADDTPGIMLPVEALIAMAPASSGRCVRIPKVLGEGS